MCRLGWSYNDISRRNSCKWTASTAPRLLQPVFETMEHKHRQPYLIFHSVLDKIQPYQLFIITIHQHINKMNNKGRILIVIITKKLNI